MVNISGGYDQNATANQQLAAGEYVAEIIESGIDDVSKKTDMGSCLKFTWKVLEGQQSGQQEWQRLNLYFTGNNAAKVVQIANSQFAEIRDATGVFAPQDTSELHHIPCLIVVGPQKNNPQYNEIKKVRKLEGRSTGASTDHRAIASQGASQPNGGSSGLPWQRTA